MAQGVSRHKFWAEIRSDELCSQHSFGRVYTGPLAPLGGLVRLHIFVDRTSVEVFVGDRQVCLTDQIFPAEASLGLQTFTDEGGVTIKSLEVCRLAPAKFQAEPAS